MASDKGNGIANEVKRSLPEQNKWQDGFEHGMRIGMINALVLVQIGALVGGTGEQRLEIVAQDFGSKIL